MTDTMKEVYFYKYCPKCENKDLKGYEDPCHDCLEEAGRENSHKPIHFKEIINE